MSSDFAQQKRIANQLNFLIRLSELSCLTVWKLFRVSNMNLLRWREGSAVKNICCSCRGTRLSSPHPHANSQQAVIPVPRNPILYSELPIFHTCRQNSNVYKTYFLKAPFAQVWHFGVTDAFEPFMFLELIFKTNYCHNIINFCLSKISLETC